MSFRPVMLRLDRGILGIGGDGEEITRSSRVMTERDENVGDNGRKRKVGDNDKERKKPLKAVKETSRITEI